MIKKIWTFYQLDKNILNFYLQANQCTDFIFYQMIKKFELFINVIKISVKKISEIKHHMSCHMTERSTDFFKRNVFDQVDKNFKMVQMFFYQNNFKKISRAKRGRSSRTFTPNLIGAGAWSQNKARGRAKRGRSSHFCSGFDRKLNPKQTLMAERSEVEAIDFLFWILPEIELKPK